MPYVGKDWRSTGDFWVKTQSGWQKLNALRENVNRHIRRLGLNKESLQNDLNRNIDEVNPSSQAYIKDNSVPTFLGCPLARYLLIPRGNAREKGNYFTLGEVMLRLDFAGCVRDPRRNNYVCRMLEVLVSSHFSCFSGTAQKNLLYAIEETVSVAVETQQNLRRVRRTITRATVELKQMQYTHVGTPATWKARMNQLQDMLHRLNKTKITEREEDDELIMAELPDDCVRLILHRLADHEDIINTGAADTHLYGLCNEPSLWKQLCYFHFTKQQILREIGLGADETLVKWKVCYQKLYRRYGRRELYADMLHVCGHCNCLYWKDGGHPCTVETSLERSTRNIDPASITSIPITPQQFIKIFPAPQ